MSPHSKSEIVRYLNLVGFETLYRIYKGRWSVVREPRRRTPFVIFRQRNNAVPRRIIMNVIQPRQIGAFKRNTALPKLKPHLSSRCVIPGIELPGRLHVKLTQKFSQGTRIGWRRCNEVVMIGQHCPGVHVSVEFARALEQGFLKEIQPKR